MIAIWTGNLLTKVYKPCAMAGRAHARTVVPYVRCCPLWNVQLPWVSVIWPLPAVAIKWECDLVGMPNPTAQ